MNKILVLGSNSQIGKELKLLKNNIFIFKSKSELNLKYTRKIINFLVKNKIKTVINLAAYTDVERAEMEKKQCLNINFQWIKSLLESIKRNNLRIFFIQISTDFVFGNNKDLVSENDKTNPLNFYGKTKLMTEEYINNNYTNSLIIRTSSVFSIYNKNFLKNLVIALLNNKKVGINTKIKTRPTSARSIANFINDVIKQKVYPIGIVHFTNKPSISWFKFAKTIENLLPKKYRNNVFINNEYKTKAKRPLNSILKYSIKIKHIRNQDKWLEYLKKDITSFKYEK
tara:strand:+ start:347 stop:1198 length:852 start_codon:yes stop_codon:yes gene_type:complete